MNLKLFWILLLAANVYIAKCFDPPVLSVCDDMENCDDDCDFGRLKDENGCELCHECIKEATIEGDIKINEKTYGEYRRLYHTGDCNKDKGTQRGAVRGDRYKWPKRNNEVRIAYDFVQNRAGHVDSTDINRIENVMKQFEERTCIRFVRRTTERDYIWFNASVGCSSYVGRITGPQQLNLGPGCTNKKGTVIHEIMHALGFWHEHSRPDRDSYIRVNYQNIFPGLESNFDVQKDIDLHGTTYDIDSVMQYGSTFFSRNGQPTIVRRDNNRPVVAQREGFSEKDVEEINERYGCPQYEGEHTITTPSVVTTSAPTSQENSCQDENTNCNYWLTQGYCQGQFRTFMSKNCRLSCNFCSNSEPPTACKDHQDRANECRSISRSNQCNNQSPLLRRFIRENCRKSCGFCNNPISTTAVTATAQITTTTNSISNCRNRNGNCGFWANEGYCSTSHQHYNYMRINCPVACRFCRKVEAASTTTPSSSITLPQLSVTCGTLAVEDTHERMLQRIVGGRGVKYGTVPWIVSIRRGDFEFCAGTLINENFVLTAAHCFYEDNNFNPSVANLIGLAGKHYRLRRDLNEKRFTFKRIIRHPSYEHSTSDNDIALVQLSSPIRFTNYVRPACLPRFQGQNLNNYTEAFVSGWGQTERAGFPEILQQVEVRTIINSVCNRWLRRHINRGYDEVTENMFCAGYELGQRDACQGDSGGPLTVELPEGRHHVMGIVSWGYGCAEQNRPGVYTKVSKYFNWIASSMNRYLS